MTPPYSPFRISGGNSRLCIQRISSMVRKRLLAGNFCSPIRKCPQAGVSGLRFFSLGNTQCPQQTVIQD